MQSFDDDAFARAQTLDDDDRAGASSARIRQPGEELVKINLVRASGEVPAGARFTATIGHDLAYRTETGDVDGEGRIRIFTTRDANVEINFRLSGATLPNGASFSITPANDDVFNIRLR